MFQLIAFVAATIFLSVCVSLSLRWRRQAQQGQRRVGGRKRRPWFAFLLGCFVLGVLSVLLTQLYIETEAHHLGWLAHLLVFLAAAMFIWSAVQFSLLYRTPVPASQRRLLNGMYIPAYWSRRPRTLMERLFPPGVLLPSGTYNESRWDENEDLPDTA